MKSASLTITVKPFPKLRNGALAFVATITRGSKAVATTYLYTTSTQARSEAGLLVLAIQMSATRSGLHGWLTPAAMMQVPAMIKRPTLHPLFTNRARRWNATDTAIAHNQARAFRTHMLRTALDRSLVTPSGVPYGWVGSRYQGESDCQGPAREQGCI